MNRGNYNIEYMRTAFEEIMSKMENGLLYGTPLRYIALTDDEKALVVAAYFLGQSEEHFRKTDQTRLVYNNRWNNE